MEQVKWDTPNKVRKCDSPLINNLWVHRTPVKQQETRLKYATYQNNAQRFPLSALPNYITPPSKVKEFINPFEPDLTNRLHLSTISPTVFTKIPSSSQQSPEFTWSIDEIALLQPAKIEESSVQQVYSPDPELEIKAQAAIDQFFTKNQIIPSPWDVKQEKNKPCVSLDTPSRSLKDLNTTKELLKLKKDVSSQTLLSLPFDLPQNIEEALKPFCTFIQEQNTDNDDANASNNSLRRKLFFNHNELIDNDNESLRSLSPVKMSESMVLSCSPPQSGMFVNGTPLKKLPQDRRQSNESSIVKTENLSPPNISPIYNIKNNILYKRVRYCSRSVNQLDFTMDMSIDNINVEKGQDSSSDTSFNENDVKCTESNHKLGIIHNDKINLCDSVNMEELPKCTDNIMHSNAIVFNDKDYIDSTSLKVATEMENYIHESHKQSNIIFNTFDQQSILNTVQDTGYQTNSTNNTIRTIDNYSNISDNYKTHWSEQMGISKDNAQLPWRENMRKVFSSTPSKCNKNNEI